MRAALITTHPPRPLPSLTVALTFTLTLYPDLPHRVQRQLGPDPTLRADTVSTFTVSGHIVVGE